MPILDGSNSLTGLPTVLSLPLRTNQKSASGILVAIFARSFSLVPELSDIISVNLILLSVNS